jgi:hypothetical protein
MNSAVSFLLVTLLTRIAIADPLSAIDTDSLWRAREAVVPQRHSRAIEKLADTARRISLECSLWN